MENIKELIRYTGVKKEHQINKLKDFESESILNIELYFENKDDGTAVGIDFEQLSLWYHWNFIHDYLKNSNYYIRKLIFSTYYGIESNNVRYFFGKKVEKYKRAVQFNKAIKHLGQSLLLGWDDLSIKYGNLLIKMLYAKQYKGWHSVYKHPWFMLEIFCKWQNIKLDYTKLNFPQEMLIYRDVLDNWDTTDSSLLSNLVNRMVNYHIEQSDEDEYEDKTQDFPSADYFIFPIEIIMWLNIRCRMGFIDYVADNELMKLPINNWHTQKTEVPIIDLVEKAKVKLLKDYLGVDFEL